MLQTGCWYDHIGAAGRPLDKCAHYQHEANSVHEQPTFDSVGLEPCHLALLHLLFHVFGNLRCRLGGHAPELIGMQVRYCLTWQAFNAAVICEPGGQQAVLGWRPLSSCNQQHLCIGVVASMHTMQGGHAWHCQWHQNTVRSSMHLVRCPAKGACQGVYMS